MLSLRVFTKLANQKVVVLLIPVISPLWLVNGAVIVEKVSKAVAKVIHHKYFKHIREATNSSP